MKYHGIDPKRLIGKDVGNFLALDWVWFKAMQESFDSIFGDTHVT